MGRPGPILADYVAEQGCLAFHDLFESVVASALLYIDLDRFLKEDSCRKQMIESLRGTLEQTFSLFFPGFGSSEEKRVNNQFFGTFMHYYEN